MNKQRWLAWHSWVGIKLAILSCFILITGTFAVISNEIDWLTNSAKRVSPLPETHAVSWQKVYDNARSQNPEDLVLWIYAPTDAWQAVEVVRKTPSNERYRQFYHPETGEYQGDGRWYNWQRFFRMTHRHLMLPTQIGITIVCIVGFLLLISGISGMVLHKNWWKDFFRKPRTNNHRVLMGDLHRLLGSWSMWLLIVICLTGVWYFVEIWGARATYPSVSNPRSPMAKMTLLQPTSHNFERIIAQTAEQRPDMTIQSIRFPSKKNRPVVVEGQNDVWLVRDRANNVAFDPDTSQLLSKRYAGDLTVHVRISEAADPLHFGTFGGIYSKIVYFIFGLILSVLAMTGTFMYALHYKKMQRDEAFATKSLLKVAWQGMQKWRWVAVGLVFICLLFTTLVFSGVVQA